MQGVPATMAASDLVDLSGLMDDAKHFALVRQRSLSQSFSGHDL
jgi:hypothetical protein